MCGINGFNFVDRKTLKRMNDSLKHRGPDAGGEFFDDNVSLGHRRLSILDLSKRGNQPMKYSHKNKDVAIVFNGEIYNFLEIREELEKKGYKFKSNSDTEVIVASYLEWGVDCVNRFNGMWAFCIYDLQKNILFLSRDRLGKKPLYYYFNGKKFIFSSELKGILKHNISRELDRDAIDLYFSLGFVPAPYSIYSDIKKLEARQNLIFNLKKKNVETNYYYELSKYNPMNDKKMLLNEGRKLLREATKLRLGADVPLGAFLSGGIDSSVLVGNMSEEIPRGNLNTFSIGFEGEYDESEYSDIVRRLFKTRHHHKYFKEGDFRKYLDNIFYYYDEPLGDASCFPTFDLCKFARSKLIVSLSGDGGDEMFGGYPRHQTAVQMEILRKVPKVVRKTFLIFSKGKFGEGLRLSLLPPEKFYSEARLEIYKPKIYRKLTEEKMRECLRLSCGNFAEAVLLFDRYFQTLPDNYLCKVDRASMGNSLEVRSPFLDYRFIEFTSKIPTKWKSSIRKNKILLREIAEEILPEEIVGRKKAGFIPPIKKWLLKDGYRKELDVFLEELFFEGILSKEWYNFYRKEVFVKSGIVYQNYLIRLYLFYSWWKFWNKN